MRRRLPRRVRAARVLAPPPEGPIGLGDIIDLMFPEIIFFDPELVQSGINMPFPIQSLEPGTVI